MKIGKKISTVTAPARRVQKADKQPKPIPVELPKVAPKEAEK